jgi:hypothetical protein
VHRAALAAAVPGVTAGQLGEHQAEVRALGDGVGVRAVPADHVVVAVERRAGADGDALLADAEVQQALQLPLGVQLGDLLLERPDPPHRVQQLAHHAPFPRSAAVPAASTVIVASSIATP